MMACPWRKSWRLGRGGSKSKAENGYVRLEDVANPNTVLSRAETPAYTMYDVNGDVIGVFELTECELSATPDLESAQAEMRLAQ